MRLHVTYSPCQNEAACVTASLPVSERGCQCQSEADCAGMTLTAGKRLDIDLPEP